MACRLLNIIGYKKMNETAEDIYVAPDNTKDSDEQPKTEKETN